MKLRKKAWDSVPGFFAILADNKKAHPRGMSLPNLVVMRPEGIEPPFQEPESYVRSITLRAHNTHAF